MLLQKACLNQFLIDFHGIKEQQPLRVVKIRYYLCIVDGTVFRNFFVQIQPEISVFTNIYTLDSAVGNYMRLK